MTTEGTAAEFSRVHRSVLDLNQILQKTIQSREHRRNAEMSLTMEMAKDLPHVSIDPYQIEHVLLRLIANAEEGIRSNDGTPGQIQVKSALQGDRIQVTVTDNGCGIHAHEMAGIFDHESTRIGLNIAAEIVKDHGGDLYAWSSFGKGSVFTMELPLAEAGHQEELPADTSEHQPLYGKRILVIDDDLHITALLYDILTMQGAEIDDANSGEEAIGKIHGKPYDLFICDQRMPDLSGEQLFHAIEPLGIQCRFLFVTGDVVNEDTMEFLRQTGVAYIRKPFKSAELVNAVETVINRSQRQDF